MARSSADDMAATSHAPLAAPSLAYDQSEPPRFDCGSVVADEPASLMDEDPSMATQQHLYGQQRASLLTAIDGSHSLLTSLGGFNNQQWTIRYPHELGVAAEQAAKVGPSRAELRRAASVSSDEAGAAVHEAKRPSMHQRAQTMASTDVQAESAHVESPAKHPLSILALDLRAGQTTAGNLPALLPSLSQATLAQLLERRFHTATQHLENLRSRVQDTSSRILVTGDLNAGKSTFVNALLRRNLLPVDQQPCTNVFCEVLDAAALNNGVEEVHAIRAEDLDRYDPVNKGTFRLFALHHLDTVCMDGGEDYALLKVYVNDATETSQSFVRNGLVSISLIDAPGLNRDTLSTTALFARQAEIDVVVFVVSAENHFTLSAKEFLWNASREKAYVFIVVNKWANIRDKARCERLVGQQIQQLSPGTWESRAELVHFVEAGAVADAVDAEAEGEQHVDFDALESHLRSFVLLKRAKSKLAPARHYVLNLLADLGLLTDVNLTTAEQELRVALERLDEVRPKHERLLRQRDEVSDGIASVEEARVGAVRKEAYLRLSRAADSLDRSTASLPPYPGLAGLWSWASAVKSSMLAMLESEVVAAEEDARAASIMGVGEIMGDLAERFLPEEQRRKDERIFRPEVMFAKRRKAQAARRPTVAGVGLSSATLAAPDVDISFLDLFDLERLLPINKSRKAIDAAVEEDAAGALSVVSLGVGAVTMFGSRAVGVKGLVESIAHVCEVLGSPAARKWAGPIIGVLTIGLGVYIVVDLPRALPRNIGRKLQAALAAPPGAEDGDAQSFANVHAERIGRETRKVLRLAGYDLRERFRAALEQSERERNEVENAKTAAEGAKAWLIDFGGQVDAQDATLRQVDLGLDVA